MRKTATALLALGLAAAFFASTAGATSLLTDTFTYPNGGLVPNGGWATHSGTGTDIQVVGNTAQGNMANAPDDNRTFAAQPTTAKTYFCFQVTIPDPGGSPSTNYFIHLKDGTTTNFVARVFVAPQGATFSFGLAVFSGTMAVQWPTALSYGTPYYVVVDYDPTGGGTGSADLWVNPSAESDPKITTAPGGTGTPFGVSAIALRQSSTVTPAGSKLWTYIVDDVGVGTSFVDACVSGPTPVHSSTWGSLKMRYR